MISICPLKQLDTPALSNVYGAPVSIHACRLFNHRASERSLKCDEVVFRFAGLLRFLNGCSARRSLSAKLIQWCRRRMHRINPWADLVEKLSGRKNVLINAILHVTDTVG